MKMGLALIDCPACKKEVSAAAATCPQCGHQLKKPTRTLFGKVMKWVLIGFNVLMLLWLVVGVGAASEVSSTAASDAERAGAAAGTALGVGLVLTLWVLGDIIIGLAVLLTRPRVR